MLVACFAGGIAGYALAAGPTVRVMIFVSVCIAAAAGCWWGPRRPGVRSSPGWKAVAAAFVALAAAEVVQTLASDVSVPWVVPLRAVATLLMALGMWRIMNDGQGGSRRGVFDAAIVAIGAGVVAWIFIFAPFVRHPDLDAVDLGVALAGPVLDLVLLAVVCRMLLISAGGTVPFRLLLAGMAVVIAGDVVQSIATVDGRLGAGAAVNLLWLVGVALIATAALHPSIDDFAAQRTERQMLVSTARLVMLGAAAVAGPVAVIVESGQGADLNIPLVVAGTVVLFVMIVLRMAGLVRALGATAQRHLEATNRERILRRAAHALVAATDRHAIGAIAADAAAALVRDRRGAEVRLFLGNADRMDPVATRGERASATAALPLSAIPPKALAHLRAGDSEVVSFEPSQLAGALAAAVGATAGRPVCLLAPLMVDGAVAGALTLALDRVAGESRRHAIETVASQAALAIETVELTEDLHARAGEERFRSLVQNASDVIAIIEPGGIIRFVTRSIHGMLGFTPEQLEGASIARLLHPDDARPGPGVLVNVDAVDWRMRDAKGGYRQVEVVVADQMHDPNVAGIVLTMRDVTRRRELEARLAHQAFHDTLTGLANRALFEDRLGQALARRARAARGSVVVIFIDLDEFKSINDTLGHQAGDELLRTVAARLSQCLRPTDTAARLGGDEFAIALEVDDFDIEQVITAIADRILAALRKPYDLDGEEVFTRGSLGIASTPDAGETVAELLRNADIAMYVAKNSGKGTFRRFAAGMHTPVLRQMELRSELQRAIEREEFVLHYQPIVSLADGRVLGMEALVRWNHPQHGLIPPTDFVPLAEESGLIGDMGRWILEEACRQFAAWTAGSGTAGRYISINLSGLQLHRGDFIADLQRVLRQTGIDPGMVLLELTETVLVADTERTITRLRDLAATGVRIAIDDFGTGFSALAYLQRLPVHVLKLAAPWVEGLRSGQEPLVETILRLADTLALDVIAEGIESPDQVETLVRLGCSVGQGFHFSRPMPTDAAGMVMAGGAIPMGVPELVSR